MKYSLATANSNVREWQKANPCPQCGGKKPYLSNPTHFCGSCKAKALWKFNYRFKDWFKGHHERVKQQERVVYGDSETI